AAGERRVAAGAVHAVVTCGLLMRGAIGTVLARPRLLLALALLNLATAWLTARPLSAALAPLVDKRPAATAMVGGDDGLAAELVSDHPSLVTVALASAAVG